jgi:hypothetical protein
MEVGDWREAQSAVSKHEGGDMRRFLPLHVASGKNQRNTRRDRRQPQSYPRLPLLTSLQSTSHIILRVPNSRLPRTGQRIPFRHPQMSHRWRHCE